MTSSPSVFQMTRGRAASWRWPTLMMPGGTSGMPSSHGVVGLAEVFREVAQGVDADVAGGGAWLVQEHDDRLVRPRGVEPGAQRGAELGLGHAGVVDDESAEQCLERGIVGGHHVQAPDLGHLEVRVGDAGSSSCWTVVPVSWSPLTATVGMSGERRPHARTKPSSATVPLEVMSPEMVRRATESSPSCSWSRAGTCSRGPRCRPGCPGDRPRRGRSSRLPAARSASTCPGSAARNDELAVLSYAAARSRMREVFFSMKGCTCRAISSVCGLLNASSVDAGHRVDRT